MGLTDAEMDQLARCKSQLEWETICDSMKAARGGNYPHDWFARVVLSGMMDSVVKGWSYTR
jgi:hypothetical protein